MREDGVPRRSGVSPCDGARYVGAATPGVADGQTEVHVATWLEAPQKHHISLAHGVVTSARQCLYADV